MKLRLQRARDIKYISFKTPRRELGAAHSSQTAELEIIYKYARARELGGGAHSSDCSARPVRETNQKNSLAGGAPARGIELAETAAESSLEIKKTCLLKNASARPARSRARAA